MMESYSALNRKEVLINVYNTQSTTRLKESKDMTSKRSKEGIYSVKNMPSSPHCSAQ